MCWTAEEGYEVTIWCVHITLFKVCGCEHSFLMAREGIRDYTDTLEAMLTTTNRIYYGNVNRFK